MTRLTNRPSLWLIVLLTARALAAAEPGPTLKGLLQREPGESRDSPPAAVRHHLLYHEKSQRGRYRYLLVITWFLGEGRTALRYTVTDDGSSENVRDVYDWALQAWHQETLGADKLKQLSELLSRLPESKAEPPIERTVHVSFHSSDRWRTETYDAAQLPDEFERVMAILGERFETKNRREQKGR